jgi:hypothetical protein
MKIHLDDHVCRASFSCGRWMVKGEEIVKALSGRLSLGHWLNEKEPVIWFVYCSPIPVLLWSLWLLLFPLRPLPSTTTFSRFPSPDC